jgi:hypothetical protein
MNTTHNFKYIKNVGGTETVIDTSKPSSINYVGHVWHDDEQTKLLGMPCWNINNGTVYLWGFSSREEAVKAITASVDGE